MYSATMFYQWWDCCFAASASGCYMGMHPSSPDTRLPSHTRRAEPNASLQLLPEAAAKRRLEAVSCKALLGQDLTSGTWVYSSSTPVFHALVSGMWVVIAALQFLKDRRMHNADVQEHRTLNKH